MSQPGPKSPKGQGRGTHVLTSILFAQHQICAKANKVTLGKYTSACRQEYQESEEELLLQVTFLCGKSYICNCAVYYVTQKVRCHPIKSHVIWGGGGGGGGQKPAGLPQTDYTLNTLGVHEPQICMYT